MQIDSSTLLLSAQHSFTQRTQVVDRAQLRPTRSAPRAMAVSPASSSSSSAAVVDNSDSPTFEDLRSAIARWLYEQVAGVKGQRFRLPRFVSNLRSAATQNGWTVHYTRQETHQEAERVQFSAAGMVHTADGREIHFSLDLEMGRSLTTVARAEATVGGGFGRQEEQQAPATDPLALNFDHTGVHLSGNRMVFDLDSDGQAEAVPKLAEGSAWLAIDRNGDGKVNDGSELFGPATGDGFAELAQLDANHDGWIDESDPGYSALRLWSPGANGGGSGALVSLHDAGLGALALATLETPFRETDAAGRTLGAIRQTGVYLTEQGEAGAIQHVDLSA